MSSSQTPEKQSSDDSKPKNRFVTGAYELSPSGKKTKSATPADSKPKANTRGWEYQADIMNIMEEFSAFEEQRQPKNLMPKLLAQNFCRRCHKELKKGNLSGFCNKTCMRKFEDSGPEKKLKE